MYDGGLRVRKSQLNVSSEKLLAEVEDDIARIENINIKLAAKKNYLGYTEWLVILVLIGALYGYVVYQDHSVPPVIKGNQHGNFSEERARIILNQIASLGPRVSGSEALEKKAFKIVTTKLYDLQKAAAGKGVNRIEVDIDRPTGCYDLKFLSSFTLCYYKITNIVARIGPSTGPTNNAILLNCHLDTLPDTPGATDDAVSCAIMIEVLENLAYSNEPLKNDIVLLFNGAEENFLQASHGFITQHKWRHQIRAFINLEGTGSGGREILFQAGPGDSWLLKTYLDHAPYPHCSVLAQEVFQSGIIPSDTDFRVFRDYGRVSGLDIAYHKNGWVYHTEFDQADYINEGAIQRAGENILAVVKALIKSPYIEQPAHFNEGNKWVFYDVVGLFTVFYEVNSGFFLNLFVVACVVVLVAYRISVKAYTPLDLLYAFFHHFQALLAMAGTGIILVGIVKVLDLYMSWYSMPELVFPLYILPMIIAGLWVHSHVAETKYSGIDSEMCHWDSVLLIWATVLFITTMMGLASSFFFLIHVLFPLFRDPLIYLLGKLQIIEYVSPRKVLYAQFACLVPVMLIVSYAVMLFFDFFVPVMGRLGNLVNPEFIMMPLSLLTALTFVLYTVK
uniref:FXNA-like protease n=1 Tax=Panagrolaimus superbus TaxID=310955 RepID=A0A914YZK8_9BILA